MTVPKTKWASGPWRVEPTDRPGIYQQTERGGLGMAVVPFGVSDSSDLRDYGVIGRTKEEALANATVMAAAPDLYTALTHALGVIVEFGDLNGFRNLTDAELGKAYLAVAKNASAALAKARGEA